MIGRASDFYSSKDCNPLEKSIKRGEISQADGVLIQAYLSEMTALHNLSRNRVLKIVTTLLGWKKNNLIIPDYEQMKMTDLFTAIQKLTVSQNQKGRLFSQNTQYDYVVILRRFLLWMIENGYNTGLNEKKIRDIKPPAKNQDTTHPDEILNPEEIIAMISACRGETATRDRALISVQYEAATRIGELGMLQWRDVIWDDYGAKIRITDKKTKRIRFARLTKEISSQYLAKWRDDYPGTPAGDSFVFVSKRSDLITYWAVLRIFKEAAERAGVKKKITTHLFRKTRGTHLIEQGLPIANVVELMWGNQNTKQIRTYIRMSPVEQDRVLLKHAGVISEEESKAHERRVSGRMCSVCHTQNSPTSRYCSGCGRGLSDDAIKTQEVVQSFLHDPDTLRKVFETMIAEKLR
jgi:integrase